MSASASASVSVPGPASTATVEPALPRVIGNYTLFDRIGRGGMADIFLARARTDLGATRLAVVKQILPHLAASREFSELLITEAKLAARLDHANVVQVHDLGRVDGFLYIAMQYVEGFDLAELLRRCARTKTPLPIQYSLFVVREVLKALDYAHRRTGDDGRPLGIVHRDVSPSNILVSYDGEVKICDFGIAHANDVVDVAPDDAIRGKAGYMSPEHANGLPVDARADVFALGIVLWELICGRRLYRAGEGNRPLLEQARAAQVPDLPLRGIPEESMLHAIVRKALSPDRGQRFSSARLMGEELENYVAKTRLLASPLRLGEWLIDHFGDDIIQQRRARERTIKALEAGVAGPAELRPNGLPEPPSVPAAVGGAAESTAAGLGSAGDIGVAPAGDHGDVERHESAAGERMRVDEVGRPAPRAEPGEASTVEPVGNEFAAEASVETDADPAILADTGAVIETSAVDEEIGEEEPLATDAEEGADDGPMLDAPSSEDMRVPPHRIRLPKTRVALEPTRSGATSDEAKAPTARMIAWATILAFMLAAVVYYLLHTM